MNYNALCVFTKVYEKGNMTAASKELHLSQPCLTLQMKSLEEYYSVRLFDRTQKGVIPTYGGKLLYQYAKEIINMNQEMENQMMKVSKNVTGQLRIGSSETFAAYILPAIFSIFKQEYSKTNLHMAVENSKSIVNKLLDYSLDMGIVPMSSQNKKIVNEFFIKDKLVFIASKDSSLAREKKLKLTDILKSNFLLREDGSNTRELFVDYLKSNNINVMNFNLYDVLGSNESIKKAVENNVGISIVSKFAIIQELKLGSIVTLDVEDFNLNRDLFFIYRKESIVGEPIKVFIKFCKEKVGLLFPNI